MNLHHYEFCDFPAIFPAISKQKEFFYSNKKKILTHKKKKTMFPSYPAHSSNDTFYGNENVTKRMKTAKHDKCVRFDVLCAEVGNIRQKNICPKNKIRSPTQNEISKGVLRHLFVEEVVRKNSKHVDKYFFSRSGAKYRSIAEIKRDTVFLNVYKDQKFYNRMGRLLTDTSAEIINELSPGATLFYQGIGRSSKQTLKDFLGDSQDIRLLQGKESFFRIKLV